MRPFIAELSARSGAAISCYPNAGLPNPLSPTGFDLKPEDMGRFLGEFAEGGLINIAGGCCGNTPDHIAAIARSLEGRHPRDLDALAFSVCSGRSFVARPRCHCSSPWRSYP